MKSVQLVRLDPTIEQALMKDPAYAEALMRSDWAQAADCVHRLLGRTLAVEPASVDELAWGGYFAVDSQTREVVGSCGYKTPPTNEGTVEIAYFTYPAFQGRGYATAMAGRLIALAREAAEVRMVVAHTLPEANASTRVLEKAGMRFAGAVNDPDDGLVWRWHVGTQAEVGRPNR